jgi:hypothetical protein
MEGGSTWNWDTVQRISKSLRAVLSRQITPTTQELMAEAERVGSAEVDYKLVKRQVVEKLAQPLQCPAQHPVIPFELRLEMNSPQAMLRVFPNQDGAPTPYLPIRLFLCGVCQEVYRERELEVRVQHPEYTQARGSAPVPEGAPLPEEAIRRGREDDHAASR